MIAMCHVLIAPLTHLLKKKKWQWDIGRDLSSAGSFPNPHTIQGCANLNPGVQSSAQPPTWVTEAQVFKPLSAPSQAHFQQKAGMQSGARTSALIWEGSNQSDVFVAVPCAFPHLTFPRPNIVVCLLGGICLCQYPYRCLHNSVSKQKDLYWDIRTFKPREGYEFMWNLPWVLLHSPPLLRVGEWPHSNLFHCFLRHQPLSPFFLSNYIVCSPLSKEFTFNTKVTETENF